MQRRERIRRAALLLLVLRCCVHVAVAFQPPSRLQWRAARAGHPPSPWRPPIGAIATSSGGSGLPAPWKPWTRDCRGGVLLVGPTAASALGGTAPALALPTQLQGEENGESTRLKIEIRAADRSDTKALVDFVLKCEGEWTTAGHAKKEALAQRLQNHIDNGVTIWLAFHTGPDAPSAFVASDGRGQDEGTLIGIYVSTAIDHIAIPRLPSSSFNPDAFPYPLAGICPRRFLSDVKVADAYKRKGIATRMLAHFEETELREAEFCGSSDGVLACLFVAKDNVAGRALYEKCGFVAVDGGGGGVDWSKRRFTALLEAGAVGVEEMASVLFMVKYVPPSKKSARDD